MYLYVYVCVYVCICVCVCLCMYMCMCVSRYVYVYVCVRCQYTTHVYAHRCKEQKKNPAHSVNVCIALNTHIISASAIFFFSPAKNAVL